MRMGSFSDENWKTPIKFTFCFPLISSLARAIVGACGGVGPGVQCEERQQVTMVGVLNPPIPILTYSGLKNGLKIFIWSQNEVKPYEYSNQKRWTLGHCKHYILT